MKYEINSPVLEDIGGYEDAVYLVPTAPRNQREALEVIAEYFKRELRYDYLQYVASEHTSDCVGVLVLERAADLVADEDHYPNYVIGGACFRVKDTGENVMDWIWLHPFARNRGKLGELWPSFTQKFGNFELTPPLSAHMKYFLERHNNSFKPKPLRGSA